MTQISFKLIVVPLLLTASLNVAAQSCPDLPDTQLRGLTIQQIAKDPEQSECSALVSVFDLLANDPKPGGRKLEENRPFNPQAAQADLAKAQADPEVRQRLDKVRKQISDPNRRLLYEAAILDEEGYYSARDLRINQLKQQLK